MIARRGEWLALEAAVDCLYLETSESHHEIQLTESHNADGEVMGPAVLERARSVVPFIEQPHVHELCGRIITGDGKAFEPAIDQLAGEVVALRGAARQVHQFFG